MISKYIAQPYGTAASALAFVNLDATQYGISANWTYTGANDVQTVVRNSHTATFFLVAPVGYTWSTGITEVLLPPGASLTFIKRPVGVSAVMEIIADVIPQITQFEVANVDKMQTLTGFTEGKQIHASGYHAIDDGGGQRFLYFKTGRSLITLDYGFLFPAAGADDYYSAVDQYKVDARRFGAKGDGITNDTSRVNAAKTTANALGKSVRFPEGTYLISSLTGLVADLDFGAVLKPTTGATVELRARVQDNQVCYDISTGGVVRATQAYVTTVNYGADPTGVADASAIINAMLTTYRESNTRIKIPSNTTHLCNSTLSVAGTGYHLDLFGEGITSKIYSPIADVGINCSLNAAYARIETLRLSGNGQIANGIYCRINTVDVLIENNDIDGFRSDITIAEGSFAQINCEDCADVKIINNRLSDGGNTDNSIDSDIRLINCQEFEVNGNRCSSANSEGILVSTTTSATSRGTIVGNLIAHHRRHGILFSYWDDRVEMSIVGNRIHNCKWTGVYSIEIAVLEPNSLQGKCSIVGNTITHCGGGYAADQAGNGAIHISGRLGTSVTGNTVTDCGYNPDGTLQTLYGRGIYLNGCSNVAVGGNAIKNCSRSGIEVFATYDADGLAIGTNSITDCVYACIALWNSGTNNKKSDIIISDNVCRQVLKDGYGIFIFEDAGGIEAAIHGNTIHGLKAGTDKAGIFFLRERAKSFTIFNNTLINWDFGIQADYGVGEEEDWIIGIGIRMDKNTYIGVDVPFRLRSVYAAVGRSNVFIDCEPGFSSLKVPAVYENGIISGYFVGGLPTRKCRNGDRLEPLVADSTQNISYVNNATQPAKKTISNSTAASDTLTVTAHGFSAGQRVKVLGAGLPAPLVAGREYFVRTAPTADTITLEDFNSATNIIDITANSGTGTIQEMDYAPNWVQYPDPYGAPDASYGDLALSAENRWMGDADGNASGDPNDSNGGANLAWTGTIAYGGTLPIGTEGKTFVLNNATVLTSGAGVGNYIEKLTLCGWVKLTSIDSGDRFIAKSDGPNTAWDLLVGGGGVIGFVDSIPAVYYGGADIPTGSWAHVAVVIDNGIGKFFVDGAQSGNDFQPTLISYPSIPVSVGALNGNFYINGEMFDWRIYSTALTVTDIAKIVAGPQVLNRNGSTYYFDLTGTAVVIAAQSNGSTNLVKATVTSSTMASIYCDNGGANNGRLRYFGTNRETFTVEASLSISCAATKSFVVCIYKSGIIVESTKRLVSAGTAISTVTCSATIDMVENDYIEIHIGNTTDDVDLTVHALDIGIA